MGARWVKAVRDEGSKTVTGSVATPLSGAGSGVHQPGPRVDVLGVHVSVTDMNDALSRVGEWIETGQRHHVCVADMNSVLNAGRESSLRRFYNRSGMTLPDGVPLVWAGHLAGFPQMQRVCGPDFMPAMLETSVAHGWSHYFLGGADGVAERLAAAMSARFPGLAVAGWECPPFRQLDDAEKAEMVARINASGADIVWIGLGAPKQEKWMAEFRSQLDASVLIGVGAAFDFHTGDVRRAPVAMQKMGLEWAYRLSQEPRRLWRRYVLGVPRFLGGLAVHPPRAV